jgi:hypothetical protein
VDGTRQAARQRALPQTETLPLPHRRFDQVCAPGYQGRKRGEVVRTRTVVLQAHTHQFLGTFGAAGNGDYRGDLCRATQVITSYVTALGVPSASVLLRLDGLYGDAAPLLDVLSANLSVIVRSRAYHLLDLEQVQSRLRRAPDEVSTHPESGMQRALYDCVSVPLTPTGPEVRLLIATHPGTSSDPAVGTERDGVVYELFVSTLPSPAFTASDVLDLYLHRGSFETVLADEDEEQQMDRWYSHIPCGQEFAQILGQWAWNIRLELGQQLSPAELRTTEFAPAHEAEAPSTDESRASWKHLRLRSRTAHRNGRAHLLRMVSLVPHLLSSQMGRCTAQPITHSIPRNGVPSAMAPYASCMLHASVIVVPAPYVRSVRRAPRRSGPDG